MAHFLTVVLIEPSITTAAALAEERMNPFFASELGEARAAKCDGFTIGGRYDGDIWGKEQHYSLTPAEHQARYGLDVVQPTENIRPVAELRPGLIPYAVITPDGQWHDCEGKDDSGWGAEWVALLATYHDHQAVAIDCHC